MGTRTKAGEVLTHLMNAATSAGDFPEVPGSLIEGAEATASCWILVNGTYFQVHLTELNPTEADVAWFATQSVPTA